ncbi:growth arrest-specific protein 1 [Onychostoma macrolepis]|uniref:growth arrest-specific protein 1 n=1 Tax=Onychostoma macrolepis TaxID=369639 RepID=UPI00272A80D3|nr:growth arrest-specific protein 1 [Onychostoma macrolepis]XP_058606991.1 growth arrest-specific protein 1 [Onychostoma macrolepis]XP_058606992.1 growth arrest-specific protein 1 [Onychostoma macrolepis]
MERSIVPVAFLWFAMMLDAQMVCWQALMRCHEERDCELAYNQYLTACDGIIRGSRRQCPSHCISALIRLNQTANGPFLETCDCGIDPECLRAKRAVEPCLPRTHPGDADGIGCTEARQRCEDEPSCQSSLTAYLSHCGQLFNGRKCSSRCKSTIEELLFMPSGVLLNQCVCDGLERPFCEVVKQNMVKLCSMGDNSVPMDHDGTDDAYEDEDYEAKPESEATDADAVMSFTSALTLSQHVVLLCIAFALAFML